jgi:uncharacterized protein YndB with AHSA1/START domain
MTKLDLVAAAGAPTIVITRTFDAPRALVFRALTDPALIPHWWGPRRHTTTVDVMDARPGGAWRFVSRDAEGNVFAFRGVYREVVPPARVVYTFEYEGMPGYVSLETVELEERDGRTTVTNTVAFHTVEDRDGMLASGMESGATESMDRLGELLITLS